MNLNELKYKAAQVSDDTFGKDRPAIGPVRKLKDEVDELLECFENDEDPSMEFADCFLILIDAYRKHFGDDVDLQKLIDDSSDKLDVVMKRTYKETSVEGVFQHVKDPVDKTYDIVKSDELNIDKIENIYGKLSLEFAFELISPETLNKIKKRFIEELPEYNIQCSNMNNTSESIDDGQVWVRITHPRNQTYIDVVL